MKCQEFLEYQSKQQLFKNSRFKGLVNYLVCGATPLGCWFLHLVSM